VKFRYYISFFTVLFLFAALISLSVKFFNIEKVRLDISGKSPSTLTERTKDFLKGGSNTIKISYYISDRDSLPTSQIELERNVREILESMKSESGGRFSYSITNVEQNPEARQRLIKNHTVPFTVETIAEDRYFAHSIWSVMLIDYLGRTRKIPCILNEHLPHLQERIVTLCEQIEKGAIPVIGVIGSKLNRYTEAFEKMSQYGKLIISDVRHNSELPEAADLLFVINPVNFSEKHIDLIKTFIADGKQVFVWFNTFRVAGSGGSGKYAVTYTSKKFTDYLESIGIIPQKKAVMDKDFFLSERMVKEKLPEEEIDGELKKLLNELKNSGLSAGEITDKMGESLAESADSGVYISRPFGLNINPNRVYLNRFFLKSAGRIYMKNAVPLEVNEKKLYNAGFMYEPVMTSPETSVMLKLPRKDGITSLKKEELITGEDNVSVISLVLLPRKAWNGKLFLFPSASVLENGVLGAGGNRNFLRNILMTYTKPDTLTSIRFSRERAAGIPELSAFKRLLLRFFAVFLMPLVILSAGFYKDVFGLRSSMIVFHIREKTASAGKKIPAVLGKVYLRGRFAVIFLVLLFIARVSEKANVRADISVQKQGVVSPYTKEVLAGISKPVEIIFVASKDEEFSFRGKELIRNIRLWLARSRNYGKNITCRTVRVGPQPDENTRKLLKEYGVGSFKLRTVIQDSYVEKEVYSSLIFRTGGNSEVVRNIYPDEIGRLEFTFVSALKRLLSGKKPKIAVVTEEERLSPAEEYHDYMEKHRLQPKFQDYFSDMKSLLKNHGYDVMTVNSRSDTDFNADLLFVLQPRILSDFMKKKFNRQLLSGKKAMVACQHYQIIPRRYRGKDFFGTVYWPRPYFTRINKLLNPYGIELKKEVLLDESSVELDIRQQIRWGGNLGIEEERADISEPFLIKASAVNFNPESVITSQLSDQFFIFGNRFLKTENWPENLVWEELIATSERVWAINWKGGFLEPESFKERKYFDSKQPLSVLVRGEFPALYGNVPREKAEGELLLTGNSVMFKNYFLTMPMFEHKNYLLNCAAALTYDRDTAALQAKSFIPKKGFGVMSFKNRLLYRFFVIFFPSFLVSCLGLVRIISEKKRKLPCRATALSAE